MINTVAVPEYDSILGMASEIVYMQKPYWCGATVHALKLSYIGPRTYYPYDPAAQDGPCILFFCGGGFQKQDRNVWVPELIYYAKHGYRIITVDYDTFAFTRFPEQLIQAKCAIRFVKQHAHEFRIDPERIAVMGESAGAQLASWTAVTLDQEEYEQGDYMNQNSHVRACVCFYPVTNVNAFPKPDTIRVYTDNYPDTCSLVTGNEPPFLVLHGTADDQVPHSQSVHLHDALNACGVPCDLVLVEGANHAGPEFMTDQIKERVLSFLDQKLKGI